MRLEAPDVNRLHAKALAVPGETRGGSTRVNVESIVPVWTFHLAGRAQPHAAAERLGKKKGSANRAFVVAGWDLNRDFGGMSPISINWTPAPSAGGASSTSIVDIDARYAARTKQPWCLILSWRLIALSMRWISSFLTGPNRSIRSTSRSGLFSGTRRANVELCALQLLRSCALSSWEPDRNSISWSGRPQRSPVVAHQPCLRPGEDCATVGTRSEQAPRSHGIEAARAAKC